MTIPGVSRRTAEVLLAEIGPDMGRRLAAICGEVYPLCIIRRMDVRLDSSYMNA